MTDSVATKSKPTSGRNGAAASTVRSRAERRPYSLDEPGRLRPQRRSSPIATSPTASSSMSEAGHIYWTNMGVPNLNDGSIERADLDGRNRRVIVPQGVTYTPKQIHLDKENGKLYWCDREGHARDAREPRRLADRDAGRDRPRRHGSARSDQVVRRDHHRSEARANLLDAKRPGQRRARAVSSAPGIDIPKGESPANRSDIEVFFDQLAGTHRSRARSDEPRALLDRPRRSSARQHRQSRADRHKARRRRS